MSSPNTADEWWALCAARRDDLRKIVEHYHPRTRTPADTSGHTITSPAAERVCELVRGRVAEQPGDPLVLFDVALGERAADTMVALLNQSWFGLPESMESRSVPGFFVLCTLCEEAELVLPEEGDA